MSDSSQPSSPIYNGHLLLSSVLLSPPTPRFIAANLNGAILQPKNSYTLLEDGI